MLLPFVATSVSSWFWSELRGGMMADTAIQTASPASAGEQATRNAGKSLNNAFGRSLAGGCEAPALRETPLDVLGDFRYNPRPLDGPLAKWQTQWTQNPPAARRSRFKS